MKKKNSQELRNSSEILEHLGDIQNKKGLTEESRKNSFTKLVSSLPQACTAWREPLQVVRRVKWVLSFAMDPSSMYIPVNPSTRPVTGTRSTMVNSDSRLASVARRSKPVSTDWWHGLSPRLKFQAFSSSRQVTANWSSRPGPTADTPPWPQAPDWLLWSQASGQAP